MSEYRTRRSGRQRKANPKYANDGWDKETLRVLRASSESSGSSPDEASRPEESQEKITRIARDGEVSSNEVDNVSVDTPVLSQSSDVETPDEDDEDMGMASDEDEPENGRPRPRPTPQAQRRMPGTDVVNATTRSRGLAPIRDRGAKHSIYSYTFGPDVEDLQDVLRARDTWLKGRDATLPSRLTLSVALNQSDTSGQHGSQTATAGRSKHCASNVSDSWIDSVLSHQILTQPQDLELYEKYFLRHKPSHSVVLGPFDRQQQYTLDYCSPLDFGWAWPKSGGSADDQASYSGERYHQGWLINVGERVNCLTWAPQHEGVQYLAVATRCTSAQRHLAAGKEDLRPAFHPSPLFPSAIQIWAFSTKETDIPGVRTFAMNLKPKLVMVVCTEWGNIRAVKWCPLDHPPTQNSTSDSKSTPLGLLGILSADGCAHILGIPCPPNQSSSSPTAFKAERAGLCMRPPNDTVFTSLTFATSSDLILGAADGSIHLFDLTDASNYTQPHSYMTHQLHNTYVTSLCTADPVSITPLIASMSANGDLALTDLRSPTQDKISINHACLPTRDIYYAPFTRSFIIGLDRVGSTHLDAQSATYLVCHHLRQFHMGLRVAKLPDHTGAATALAGSHHHPCILVGNAKGQVHSTNYLRKVLPYRRADHSKALGAYLQKICEYDWRPFSVQERAEQGLPEPESEKIDLFHGHDSRPGVSRFHEGFKPEKIQVGNMPETKKKAQKKDAGAGEPIFEEEHAVTALEWNPNPSCAGIAAMGWGSGIVRVQDLAHDME
ncbi:hypothetical protein PV05_06701 [Exophiala xenobiotica]|uniref:Uncharacterized protein n=1 Tax=Exophiala xenobiotica TaxID=348802 RepID=A0A0D2CW17_9EURO|nr:uncharacterized protein PV05_06701 [Exophiala xenobiotica]KIW54337.1 hypothetical protein PV05_06701 [Exophiala xenobiotica]